MKTIRIILFVLIIIGVGLLFSQNLWVPKVVNYFIQKESASFVPVTPIISTSTPVVREGKVDTGVEGIATIGPTCPVERIPPDSQCADKPYKTTLVLMSTLPGRGTGIMIFTGADGYFSKELTPGTYTISAPQNGIVRGPEPVTFEVTLHKRVSLNLHFDSGIR